jgi:hypothetical protein
MTFPACVDSSGNTCPRYASSSLGPEAEPLSGAVESAVESRTAFITATPGGAPLYFTETVVFAPVVLTVSGAGGSAGDSSGGHQHRSVRSTSSVGRDKGLSRTGRTDIGTSVPHAKQATVRCRMRG